MITKPKKNNFLEWWYSMRTHHCPTACECFLSGLFLKEKFRDVLKKRFGEVSPFLAIFTNVSTGIHFSRPTFCTFGNIPCRCRHQSWSLEMQQMVAMMCCVDIYIYYIYMHLWLLDDIVKNAYIEKTYVYYVYVTYIYIRYIYSPRVVSNHHPWLWYGAWVDKVFLSFSAE